ncbi:ATP synthase subunit C [bacterium]|nr:ATP synthase subunit C [bacterium]
MDFGMVGPALALGLSAIGAAIGCGMAGITSHGVMSRIDEGHAKLLGLSAVPASQMIYGFVLMLLLSQSVKAGGVSPLSAIGIGASSGAAIMVAAIYQGLACVSAIQAVAKKPGVFGKTFVAIGIVESFALFAFVFALLLI